MAVLEPRRIETGIGQEPLDLIDREFRDFDFSARTGRQESPQAMVVLPVEGPADDDGVKHDPGARATGLLKQILDDVERVGAWAGHGAHRVQLIDDQDARASGGFGRRRREHQDRGFFKTEVPTEIRGGRYRRERDAVETERQHRQSMFAQGLRDLDDAGRLPGAGLAGHHAVGRSLPQPGQQRFRRLPWNEGFLNEPSPCAGQVPVRCFPHGDARTVRGWTGAAADNRAGRVLRRDPDG